MDVSQLEALIPDAQIFPRSVREVDGETFAYAKHRTQHYLIIAFNPQLPALHHLRFSGEVQDLDESVAIKWCYPQRQNASKLRVLFPFTAPQVLGLKKSFGVGDRIGLDAPAHIRAARACNESGFALVLAQQSLQEMEGAQRTPDMVLDAATWGAFQEGYERPWGADADRLQTEEDVHKMAASGFTWFTIDSSEHVDGKVHEYSAEELREQFERLEDHNELISHYADKTFQAQEYSIAISQEEDVMRAAVKYSRAVKHTVSLAKLLEKLKGASNFDLEMSVAETQSPTSMAEHYFMVSELKRRGVQLTSLALHFVGAFQKGIDYIGNSSELEARLKEHVAIAETLGPYKISVHVANNNYSIYPVLSRICGELLHIKTSGTWYFEALRTVALRDASLFREICEFAEPRFITGRVNHVTENLDELPEYKNCGDNELQSLLNNNTFRQMLCVTTGPVLTDKTEKGAWRFRSRLYELWRKHEDLHLAIVEESFTKHLRALGLCK